MYKLLWEPVEFKIISLSFSPEQFCQHLFIQKLGSYEAVLQCLYYCKAVSQVGNKELKTGLGE